MQPFSTAIFSITVIISTISIYTSASITIDVLNSVFVAKILKKHVNFWIGRVKTAKITEGLRRRGCSCLSADRIRFVSSEDWAAKRS